MATSTRKSRRKLRGNHDELVMLSVCGDIVPAVWPNARAYRLGGDGVMRMLPGTGGICYSHQVGDSACRIQGDHVEAGVTMRHSDVTYNASLNVLSCVGNDAVVTSGPAEGRATPKSASTPISGSTGSVCPARASGQVCRANPSGNSATV